MIFTSYFANKQLPKHIEPISISRITPSWFKGREAKELAPSYELLKKAKEGSISNEQYKEIYIKETLSKLTPFIIHEKYNGKALLCYEVPEDFCHRQIVAEWLNEHGYETKEAINKKENIVRTKIAVVGSRNFTKYFTFKYLMDKLIANYEHVELVSGGARGTDSLAEQYAKERNIPIKVFEANWEEHGKAAGFIRNKEIWDYADLGIAFWDEKSPGTKHSIELAKKQNKKLYVFNYLTKKFIK